MHTETEISSETHHSVNTDDNHNTCDTDDEDPRPAKRRKRHSPLHLRRSHPLVSPSTTSLEVDDAHPQTNRECSPKFIYNKHHHASRTSRSPSAAAESVLAAEYEEWPLHGFLKRTRIGSTTSFNLEFHLTHVPERLKLSGLFEVLRSSTKTSAQYQTSHSTAAHSKTRHVKSRHPMKHIQAHSMDKGRGRDSGEDEGRGWLFMGRDL
jgi:hypothetical protein